MVDLDELRARLEAYQTGGPPIWVREEELSALLDIAAAAQRASDAWGESWDCSATPGHPLMYRAIAELEEALAAAQPPPEQEGSHAV